MATEEDKGRELVAFSIKDIPTSLGLELFSDVVRHYAVFLFAIRNKPEGLDRIYAGSGTLISYLEKKYILTAYHVWHKLLDKADYIGIFVKPSADLYRIDRKYLHPIMVGHYKPRPEEWGPDLALLPLGPPDISCIQMNKVFYNLSIRKEESQSSAPAGNLGLWFAVGAPDELNEVTPRGICLAIRAYGSVLLDSHMVNGFDYLDFSLDHKDRPTMPSSFGGLSGGGLWHVDLSRSRSTGKISICSKPTLEGVIYYEEFQSRGVGFIRCHGRKSIYNQAISAIVSSV